MELNTAVIAKLDIAFQGDAREYAIGYRDALESLTLALQGVIPEGLLADALETALDAYANNADHDFEDDGHDFDPDC